MMDRDRHATLHHKKFLRKDVVIDWGRVEDMVRQFRVLAPSKQTEYFIIVGTTRYGPREIENLAREFGIGR
jgi:hypothetical protein